MIPILGTLALIVLWDLGRRFANRPASEMQEEMDTLLEQATVWEDKTAELGSLAVRVKDLEHARIQHEDSIIKLARAGTVAALAPKQVQPISGPRLRRGQ